MLIGPASARPKTKTDVMRVETFILKDFVGTRRYVVDLER
jgi:hypothetical protein